MPCQWNATCFSARGVTKPIRQVPLGIDPKVFQFAEMDMEGPCVFGAAGRLQGGGRRKGLEEVVDLFRLAFPSETDVRLRLKAFPDCGVKAVDDPRIDLTAEYLVPETLARWYASLTCFVGMSRSEGWGLMPHQAMATGRPCIAVKFGGQAEFLNEQVGYCADFRLEPARLGYSGGGLWAEPVPADVVRLMRHVYQNRQEAREMGARAAKGVAPLTWQRSNRALLDVLLEFGMVSPINRTP